MKPIACFLIILLAGLTACRRTSEQAVPSAPLRVTSDQVETKANGLYLKSTGERFSGVVAESWPNGEASRERHYQDGLLHGVEREWYLNGELKREGSWRQGVRHGIQRERSKDGLEEFVAEYHEGRLIREKGNATKKLKAQIQAATRSREAMDLETWGDEVKAQEYELTVVQLWDDLRGARHDWQPLHDFMFTSVGWVKKRQTVAHQHSVTQSKFEPAVITKTREQWQQQVEEWKQQGYQLVETEWHQEVFEPAQGEQPARSEFKVVAHVQRGSERLILRGRLEIAWLPGKNGSGRPLAGRLKVLSLDLYHRDGPQLFAKPQILDVLQDNPERVTRLRQMAQNGAAANVLAAPLLVEDVTGDGLPDIIMAGANRLYLNQGDMKFKARPLLPKLRRELVAAVLADFDRDGQLDLFAVANGAVPALFRGTGDGHFEFPPRTVDLPPLNFAQSITAGDVDGDGDLDVYLAQYKPPYGAGQMPTPYHDANDGAPAFLLINDGQGGFSDGTQAAGLGQRNRRRTFSASLVDLDADRDLDLVVVSDFAGIDLFLNDGSGKFSDVTQALGDARYSFGMSHALADFNGDGQLDVYMTGMGSTTARRLTRLGQGKRGFEHLDIAPQMGYGNRLLLGQGSGRFQQPDYNDVVARTGWSWGCTPWDFDNDGDRDLYIANGNLSAKSAQDYCTTFWRHDLRDGASRDSFVMTGVYRHCMAGLGQTISWNGYEHNALFVNQGTGRYANISFLAGLSFEFDSRSVVSADLDVDGRADLLVVERDKLRNTYKTHGFVNYVHVVKNQMQTGNHWLGVQLPLDNPNYMPQGAEVWVQSGGRRQMLPVVTGDSYKAQHPVVRHFGLGQATEVDWIEVRWPNGKLTRIIQPKINAYFKVKP